MREKIIIIGGDERQDYLKDFLQSEGFGCVHIKNKEEKLNFENAKALVLPVPWTRDSKYIFSKESSEISTQKVLGELEGDTVVFGGGFKENTKRLFEEKELSFFDFLSNEPFLLQNAWYTAQGALFLLLKNTKEYISGKKALVTGFGRVGQSLALLLSKNGLKVTVAARNPIQLCLAENLGFRTKRQAERDNDFSGFDFIFNTVACRIINEDTAKTTKEDCLYFELASAPYGTEEKFFQIEKRRYIEASALPGKFLPRSAGELMGRYILEHL